MDRTISKLHQIEPNQVDPALGFGTFACVSRITGTNLAIKVPFADAVHHIPNEQSIYERLGEHHLILKYYQKTDYVTGGRAIPGLLLQFLEAGTLADNLNSPRWIENRNEWLIQATEAIAYIHSKSIVHYDLGCHNFLIQDDSTLALCDFGGSSIDGSKVLEFPKPRYTRTQRRHHDKPNVKDDIFALGTILYEISTGHEPYEDKSDNEVMSLFHGQKYPELQVLLPPGMGDIIRNCWLERYSDVGQIMHDLGLALHQERPHRYLSNKWLPTASFLGLLALCAFLALRRKGWSR